MTRIKRVLAISALATAFFAGSAATALADSYVTSVSVQGSSAEDSYVTSVGAE